MTTGKMIDYLHFTNYRLLPLEILPNFSRLIHDYIGDKKGFVEWKGQLEERLM